MNAGTKKLPLIARCLLGVAAAISAYLAWVAFSTAGNVSGCAEGASCDRVLSSSWARVFGLPVALLGTLVYVLAAVFAHKPGQPAQGVRNALLILIPLAAAWFIGVQIFAIGAVCTWCCAAHLTASLAAILLLSQSELGDGGWIAPTLGASAAAAMFAAVQLIATGAGSTGQTGSVVSVYELNETPAKTSNLLSEVKLLDGKVSFRLDQLPIVGVAQPQRAIVALTDYTCPHCRKLHDVLQDAGQKLDNGVAILKLPATRSGTESAQVHRHMLAMWKANPKMHWALERSIIEGRISATAKAVEAEAVRLVGASQFAEATVRHQGWINEQIANTRRVQDANRAKTGKGTLPQVMIGSELVMGAHSDPAFYVELAETQFGISAKNGAIPAAPRGVISLEKDRTVRLGEIQPGATLPFTVSFKNHDQTPLEISWLNMGANVTVKTFTKSEIYKSQEAELDLAMDIPESALPGPIQRTITVNTQSGHRPITFTVAATVAGDVTQAAIRQDSE